VGPTSEGSGSVAYDINLAAGNTSGFETLVVRFDGFELRNEGETVRRDGTGNTYDLASMDSTVDLLQTNVPAGEYTDAALFLPVEEFATTDGSGEGKSFTDNDPLLEELDSFDPYVIEEDTSKRFRAQVSVRKSYDIDGWEFNAAVSL
jgi:hypothetical protein